MNTTDNPYHERQASLRQLGFLNYEEYLASDLWRSIRSEVLVRSPQCISCGAKSTQVHHSDYSLLTMRGELMDVLLSCCGRCHRRSEKLARKISDPRDRLQAVTLGLLSGKNKQLDRSCRKSDALSKRGGFRQVWGNSATWRYGSSAPTTGNVVRPESKSTTKWKRKCVHATDMTPKLVRQSKKGREDHA